MNLDERLYAAARELKGAISEEARLTDEVDWCDKATIDLLHEIELSPLNAAERIKVFNRLREVRQRRRICKNSLAVIRGAKQITAYHMATRAIGQVRSTYRPRVLKDLKCGRLEHIVSNENIDVQ